MRDGQARQSIRRHAKENPTARIVVTGCAAQIDAAAFGQMDEVDLVLGNVEKLDAKSYAFDFAIEADEKIRVNDIMSVTETAPQMIEGIEGRARAFVQIQNGCDHRCTFCIIPFGRGNSRSVPAGQVVAQVTRLVDNGYKEVVLTGVDLTSYGPDLPGRQTLGFLVEQILKSVPGLERLRLSSIDSIEIDDQLFDLIVGEKRMLPHLHLSLQSGDDLILKRMKRRHNRADAIGFCQNAKSWTTMNIFRRKIRPETSRFFGVNVEIQTFIVPLAGTHIFVIIIQPEVRVRKTIVILIEIQSPGKSVLFQTGLANNKFCFFLSLAQRWKQYCKQQSDDRNHHQKFD